MAAPGRVVRRALAVLAVVATAVTGGAGVANAADGWTITGSGFGHGVGMSQYGAYAMATSGHSAKQILAHYYSGTTVAAVRDDTVIAVNLLHSVSSVRMTTVALDAGGGAFSVLVGSARLSGAPGQVLTLTRTGASVQASLATPSGTQTLTGTQAIVLWSGTRAMAGPASLLDVAGPGEALGDGAGRYRTANVLVTPSPGTSSTTLEVVNRVRVHDEYLDYLGEVPWSWPAAALQAQATAARGYALTKLAAGVRSVCACHVYDTTSDQVYGGWPSAGNQPYLKNWTAAVDATEPTSTTGWTAQYGGKIIEAYYASSTGGRTQNNEDVWGGPAVPYLRSVADPYSLTSANPRARWQTTRTAAQMASAFGLPDVADLDLRARTAGWGVASAVATSAAGQRAILTGEQLRRRLALSGTWIQHDGQRLSGGDRYSTAAAVARSIQQSATTVVLASGDSRAIFDGTVAAPLAGTLSAPLMLTTRDALPASTVAELDRRKATLKNAVVVGGPGSVSDAVVADLEGRGLSVQRIGGANRYAVAEGVAATIRSHRTTPYVVVGSGTAIADVLGSSGPAAALGYPILLTGQASLTAEGQAALDATGATIAYVVGGPASVSDAVIAQLKARGMTVRRLGGASRYEVAANVARYLRPRFAQPAEIVVTSGADAAMADSLAAGARQRLMVLVGPTTVPEASREVLTSTPTLSTVTVVGGPASVSDAVLLALRRS
jgi:SpoIID/LytB domain protein